MNQFPLKNSKLIYRDMIKMIKTIMEERKRAPTLAMIRKEFEKNRNITDENEINRLRKNAMRSIGELYLFYVKNTTKDANGDGKEVNPDRLL
jgi:hypothetical protein